MVTVPERQYSVLVQGVSRIGVLSLSEEEGPMLHGAVVRLHNEGSISDPEVRACDEVVDHRRNVLLFV